ncbi:MAG: DegV family protein [Eubacteriaceae bacterium]|jgi:DegV family protein with EDD domain|nr:DegV family protein [Eubacteriaceae bacterium]
MRKTRIICDSGSDLTVEEAKALSVERLPLYAIKNEEVFRDGVDLLPDDLYRDMRAGASYTTSQIPLEVFLEIFEKIAEEGDDCLYLGFSSALSGTYGAGKVASDMVKEKHKDFRIRALDTMCASLGCGKVVSQAAMYAKEGMGLQDLCVEAQRLALAQDHLFSVDDVSYLARGGRISKASAILAGALDIRPILDVKDGALNPIKKVRGVKKVAPAIVSYMQDRAKNPAGEEVWIGHADDMDKAESLKRLIAEAFGAERILIKNLGAVIGAHVGPGTVAVFFTKTVATAAS